MEPSPPQPAEDLPDLLMMSGMTTRPTTLRTGEVVVYAREFLDDAVKQIEASFLPITVEHLRYLPPVGRIAGGTVRDADDGHAELYFLGRELHQRRTSDLHLAIELDAELFDSELGDVRSGVVARNFDDVVFATMQDEAPVPLDRDEAYSILPPLIWTITVPVTWGLVRFAGAFMDGLGKGTGERVANWIVTGGRRAKDSARENLIEIRFETSFGTAVSGFVPLDVHTSTAVDELKESLDRLGPIAQFAGTLTRDEHAEAVALIAFVYSDGGWQLAWWASPEAAYVSPWFIENCPDPKRFLGRPLFEDESDATEVPVPSTKKDDDPHQTG